MAITRSQTGKSVSKKEKKISKVMREFKKVKNRKQALAIALSEAGVKKKRRRT
jgi:hypothetical protein